MQQNPSAMEQYRNARRRAFEAMGLLRQKVDEWLTAHEEGPLALIDLAELEALNGQRDTVIADLQKAEATMIEHMIHRMQKNAP